jgi:perosamine synthetase
MSVSDPLPFIPVYEPSLLGNEKRYVNDCLDTNWISSIGVYIDRFEQAFREATGAAHAMSVSNGTVALHLAFHCLDIGPGDEVIVPTFTYVASVNTIAQTGAKPVFVDSREGDWLIDPEDVLRKLTPRTKAIVPVHLYGAICDMGALEKIAREHRLAIVEDCAEALGATKAGRHVGSFGDIGTFSFFGNKTITTGEGGMVVARDKKLADRLRMVKGQGMLPSRRYWHTELGFNYRMTNICAAIGLGQIERLPQILARKRAIAQLYRKLARDLPVTFQHVPADVSSSDWLVTLLLPRSVDRDEVMEHLRKEGIDSRPAFYCAHQMPAHERRHESYPVAEDISSRGISLPSYPTMTNEMVLRVVEALRGALTANT